MNQTEPVKILCADWVLPVSSEPIARGAVAVNGDKIAAVGTKHEVQTLFPNAEVEDFGEAAILPGFVNAHTHLELTAMRGFLDDVEHDFFAWLRKLTVARNEKMSAKDLRISAVSGVIEAARAGITCLADIATEAKESIAALETVGLRGIVFQEILSPDAGEAEQKIERLREQIAVCREIESETVKVGVSPHAPYSVSPKLFELATDFAVAENLAVTIHAAESKIEEDFLLRGAGLFSRFWTGRGLVWNAPGVSTIEYLDRLGVLKSAPLLAHCVRVSEKDLELIAESNSKIAHCPKSNAKFGHGIAPLNEFLNEKIAVGLGSDSVASNNVADILDEARTAALFARAKGDFISAEDALFSATLGGARAIGLENQIGSLEIGKQADLIAIRLDRIPPQPIHSPVAAIVFASSARDVVLTMVAGLSVYSRGKITTTNENEWREKLKQTARKLSA